MKRLLIAAIALLTIAPLLAQAPKGWKMPLESSERPTPEDRGGKAESGAPSFAQKCNKVVLWTPPRSSYS